MKLSEIFAHLSFGELSNISIGGADTGKIDSLNYDRMVSHVNLGLTALYKRFPLKENQLVLQLVSGRLSYPLTSAYAVSNAGSTETVKYILDSSGTPFQDDLHKVSRVYTDAHWEMGLNDLADPYSVRTTSANVLAVPSDVVDGSIAIPIQLQTKKLVVVYRANHPIIAFGGLYQPERIEVELPHTHLEALLLFIASRVNNPIGMTNEFHAGSSYAAKFEAECQRLELINVNVDQASQHNRLYERGWV